MIICEFFHIVYSLIYLAKWSGYVCECWVIVVKLGVKLMGSEELVFLTASFVIYGIYGRVGLLFMREDVEIGDCCL